jgi:integrase
VAPLHALRAASLTTGAVQTWIEDMLEEEWAPATINHGVGILSAAYHFARKQTPPRVAVIPYLPRLTVRNAREGFFERAEFTTFVAALPPVVADVSWVAYAAGPRRGELFTLQWPQVDRARRPATQLDTKNGDRRTISLDGEAWPAMERRWKARALGCPYVFHRGGVRVQYIWNEWMRACRQVGFVRADPTVPDKLLPTKMFHDFRRTYARDSLNSGVPESTIMRQGGWRSRQVFLRYAIVSVPDLHRAAQAVAAHRRSART